MKLDWLKKGKKLQNKKGIEQAWKDNKIKSKKLYTQIALGVMGLFSVFGGAVFGLNYFHQKEVDEIVGVVNVIHESINNTKHSSSAQSLLVSSPNTGMYEKQMKFRLLGANDFETIPYEILSLDGKIQGKYGPINIYSLSLGNNTDAFSITLSYLPENLCVELVKKEYHNFYQVRAGYSAENMNLFWSRGSSFDEEALSAKCEQIAKSGVIQFVLEPLSPGFQKKSTAKNEQNRSNSNRM